MAIFRMRVQSFGPTAHPCFETHTIPYSYVTQDNIYCVYFAPNEEMVREHARQGGFRANRVSR